MSVAACLMLVAGLWGQADDLDPQTPDAKEVQRERWNKFYSAQAALYDLRLHDDQDKRLVLEEPVLTWSNPIRQGDTNGLVYVWTHEGRVEVVGTIFSYLQRGDRTKRQLVHSFHTLSLDPVTARLNGTVFWSPLSAGVEVKPIPDAPPPAESRTLRRSQMRTLSRQFTASIEPQEEGAGRSLRLVAGPLHRYRQASDAVLDGALFTFVMGTDPEVMLLIEARRINDQFAWHYAAARFSHEPLRLRHKGETVWTYTPDRSRPSPYYSRTVLVRDAELP